MPNVTFGFANIGLPSMRRLDLRTTFAMTGFCLFATGVIWGQATSPLFSRGFTVIPAPRRVNLERNDFRFGSAWRLEIGPGVAKDSAAVRSLAEDLESRFGVVLKEGSSGAAIRLEIAPGSVQPGPAQDRDAAAIAAQAYRLELSAARIRITANGDAGLFYGIETLVQLTKPRDGALWLPAGEILDWPDLQLRQIYWDDAHHLDHLSELKRAVRQAAFYKVNGFALKLEGHFQYHSAPAVVEPYALTPAELQELTNYGVGYHVQVIPYLDGPAHIAFILKHPEYSKLRAFPDSNYELCTTNPDSYQLMLGMFGDLLAANQGVKPIILSTDEPYYIGMADNAQCHEAARTKELGTVGRVLDEFITKVATYLHDHGRTVIFWGEYPMIPADIAGLPSFVVNGETYGPEFDPVFKAHGVRQMIYTSTEGEEPFFPDYFPLPAWRKAHGGRGDGGRVAGAVREIATNAARRNADLMGALVAGWADMGLHPETFWLGYATIPAAAWNPEGPGPHEVMSAFYPLFYGPSVGNMDRVYQLMSFQAQVWNDTWERVDSHARKPIWGNSERIFQPPHPAHDRTVPLPKAPGEADLSYDGAWSRENAKRLEVVDAALPENDALLGLLHENLRRAEYNRDSLEVFVTLAHLFRQNLEMLRGLAQIDSALSEAQTAAKGAKEKDKDALAAVDQALEIARHIRGERNQVLRDATATWYKTWYPRVAGANGRHFLHELDDVKDHLPDRTVDMSYLVYDELLLPLGEWYDRTQSARNRYAEAHHLPLRNEPLDWSGLE
jgi:hexosaminidase